MDNQIADAVVATGFGNAGQVCISTQRVVALDAIYGDLLDALKAKIGNIAAGDPLQEGTKMGPMIRQPNYEVGPEFVQRFCADDAANQRFFAASGHAGYALFDLAGYIHARIARAGIAQVDDIGLCTYAEPDRFYSFRRSTHRGEADYGRHVNAIALVG